MAYFQLADKFAEINHTGYSGISIHILRFTTNWVWESGRGPRGQKFEARKTMNL